MERAYILYLRRLSLALAGATALAVAGNIVVDPYDVTRLVVAEGFNAAKPREWEQARITKPMRLLGGRYDGILLGASQVERGLDPASQALASRGTHFYNGGFSEQRIYESAHMLERAAAQGARTAVVSLDFLRYAGKLASNERLLPMHYDTAATLVAYAKSLASFGDSFATIAANRGGRAVLAHREDGLLDVGAFLAKSGRPDFRDTFDKVDAEYLNRSYRNLATAGLRISHDDLRRLMTVARRARVELHLFVPPAHVRQTEILRQNGFYPAFQQWKCDVVREIAAEAAMVGAAPFALWDFSGVGEITTERVPAGTPGDSAMRWYDDPVHFTPATGDRVLRRIFDPESEPGFGVQLDRSNAEAEAASARRSLDAFIAGDPGTPAAIERLKGPGFRQASSGLPAELACARGLTGGPYGYGPNPPAGR